MSQTTPAPPPSETPAVVPPSSTVPEPDSSHRLARSAGPVALVGGAVLAAVGMGLHLPAMPEDEGIVLAIAAAPDRWLAAHVAQSFGFTLLAIGAAMALPAIRRRRGGTPTAVGIVLTAVGAAVMAFSDAAHGAVGFALVDRIEPALAFEIQEAYFEQPVVLALNSGPMLLSLGMIALGIGLLRSPGVPRWQGLLLVLTPLAVNVSFNLPVPPAVHGLPIVIGMTALALALFGTPRADVDAAAAA